MSKTPIKGGKVAKTLSKGKKAPSPIKNDDKKAKNKITPPKKDVSLPSKGKRSEPVKIDTPIVADVKKTDGKLKKTDSK